MSSVALPRQGDAELDEQMAWAALVERFAPSLWASARAAGARPQQAAEACQLVWLRLELQSRRSGLPSDLPGWLVEQMADATRTAAGHSA